MFEASIPTVGFDLSAENGIRRLPTRLGRSVSSSGPNPILNNDGLDSHAKEA